MQSVDVVLVHVVRGEDGDVRGEDGDVRGDGHDVDDRAVVVLAFSFSFILNFCFAATWLIQVSCRDCVENSMP